MADSLATSTASQGVGQFFSWWKQQLKECVPLALRNRLARSRRPAMWSPADDKFWPASATLTEARPMASSSFAQRGGAVALVIGENNGFRRELDMPLAVEDRLQQVLSYELDRLTPLKANELFYDFRVSRRDTAAGTCTVVLAAAPRSRVQPLLDAAKSRNIEVTRLLLAPSDVDTSLDLLKSTQRVAESSSSLSAWITPALVAVCVGLVVALVAFPLWQMRRYVIELQPIEAKAKSNAEAASIVQRQLEKQIGEYNLPLAKKHGAPLVVQLLDDLSKRMPDDTWAQSVEIRSVPNQKGKEIVLQGETGSGGKILQLVQESPMIKDPVMKGAMTRVAPNAERFHIAGEVIPAELPKQLLLAEVSNVITVPVSPASPAGAPVVAPVPGAAKGAPVVSTPAVAPSVAPSATPPPPDAAKKGPPVPGNAGTVAIPEKRP
jgi:general secretion pathway protein L